jgi:hypothetical protein
MSVCVGAGGLVHIHSDGTHDKPVYQHAHRPHLHYNAKVSASYVGAIMSRCYECHGTGFPCSEDLQEATARVTTVNTSRD